MHSPSCQPVGVKYSTPSLPWLAPCLDLLACLLALCSPAPTLSARRPLHKLFTPPTTPPPFSSSPFCRFWGPRPLSNPEEGRGKASTSTAPPPAPATPTKGFLSPFPLPPFRPQSRHSRPPPPVLGSWIWRPVEPKDSIFIYSARWREGVAMGASPDLPAYGWWSASWTRPDPYWSQ